MATETLALFEHLEFDFLEEFDVFARGFAGAGRLVLIITTSTLPSVPALLLQERLRHPSSRENSRTRSSGSAVASIDRRRTRSIASSPTSNTSSTGSSTASSSRPPAAACFDIGSIDSTDVRTMPADKDASKRLRSTAEEYYHGYVCTIVSTGQKIPIAAEFTEQASARGDGDARHV